MEVLAPIQEGANRVLKPFRDLFGWFGDTLDAKEERDKAEAERDALQKKLAEVTLERDRLEQLKGLDQINTRRRARRLRARSTARVIARSPSSWYQTLPDQQGLERRRARSTSRSSTAPGWSARSRRSPTATPS